jgi:hypothetical protein
MDDGSEYVFVRRGSAQAPIMAIFETLYKLLDFYNL